MTKLEATKAAKALKAKMRSKGWKIKLWENFGWHYCISHGQGMICVHPVCHSPEAYYCLLSDGVHHHTGSNLWGDHKRYEDPNEAVDNTIQLAFDAVHKLMRHLNRVSFPLHTGRLICK